MMNTQNRAERRTRATTFVASGVLAFVLAGCGAAGETGQGEAGRSDWGDQGADVGASSQAISEGSCATAKADESFDHKISSLEDLDDSSYSNDDCTKSYVVDLFDIDKNLTGTSPDGGDRAVINVKYADKPLSTKSTCEATYVRAIVYTRKNGAWVQDVDSGKVQGRWVAQLPDPTGHTPYMVCSLSWGWYGMKPGGDYRFTLTARASDNSTRKVNIETIPWSWVR